MGSGLEVSGWLQNLVFFFFFCNTFLVRDCGDASNRSVFALIPKLTQDNQNKIEITEK